MSRYPHHVEVPPLKGQESLDRVRWLLHEISPIDDRWCVAPDRDVTRTFFAFKDGKDAMLFKLVWGGK